MMNKKYLLVVFFILNLVAYSSDFEFYELDSDFLKKFKLGESMYLIETRNQSCLLFNSKEETYSELYTGLNKVNQIELQNRILSVSLLDNYVFITSSKSNRFISLDDNSILIDSTSNIRIDYSFLNIKNELIGTSNDGNIYSIEYSKKDNAIYYNWIGQVENPIFTLSVDREDYLVLSDGSLYNILNLKNIEKKIDINQRPSYINVSDKYIIFEYPNYYLKYSKNFEFIERIITNSYFYSSANDGYFVPKYTLDTMKVFEFNNKNQLLRTSAYSLPSKLRVLSVNTQIMEDDFLYLFSDRKYICKFSVESGSFEEISILNLPQALFKGESDFYNNKIGGICSDNGSLYLTNDEGITWKRFFEFKNDKDPNNFFSEINMLSNKGFIAFGNSYRGTVLSNDFGKTYSNISQPSGNKDNSTFFERTNSGNIIQTYDFNSSLGTVQSFRKFDNEFNKLKDTYLLDYYYDFAALVGNQIKSISHIPKPYPELTEFYIIETDTNFSKFNIIPLGEKVSYTNGIVSYKSKFYMLVSNRDIETQYLLSSNENSSNWDTIIISKDVCYDGIYAQDDKLYLLDSNNILSEFKLENNQLEMIAQLPKVDDFIKSLSVFDDVIYVSYGTYFCKGVRIQEVSTRTNVEVVPTFSSHPPYPLPSKEYVNIKLDYDQRYDTEDIELEIYNSNGALLNNILSFSMTTLSSYQINLRVNLSEYKQGVYFIKVMFGNKSEYIPIVRN